MLEEVVLDTLPGKKLPPAALVTPQVTILKYLFLYREMDFKSVNFECRIVLFYTMWENG